MKKDAKKALTKKIIRAALAKRYKIKTFGEAGVKKKYVLSVSGMT
jgi:hypothetical protein